MKKNAPPEPGNRLQDAVAVLTAFGAFLLPLKFGTLAVMPESSGFFPDDWFSWIIINWPAHFFGVVSAFLLIAALAAFRIPKLRSEAGATALLWGILLPLATLPGWIGTSAPDYAWGQSAHFFGVGAFIFSVFLTGSGNPRYRRWILNAFAAAVLWVGADAMHQYFFGFANMREFLEQQIAAGVQVGEVMKIRIYDTRVYSTFVSCNTLAGFLLLAAPVAVWIFSCWGKRFEPVRVSRILFAALGGALLLAALLLTKSRGAYLCALLTGAALFFSLPLRRRWKALCAVAAALVIAGGAFYIHRAGRGFVSMSERVDYLKSSVVMCGEHPLAGAGWGGFFRWHMKHKTTDSDESARDPHNLVASFASQAGIPAGVIALAALLSPLCFLWKQRRKAPLEAAVFWGWFAFALHTMMEINGQIPATLAAAGMLAVLMLLPETPEYESALSIRLSVKFVFAAVALSGCVLNWNWLRAEYALERLTQTLASRSGVAAVSVPASPDAVMEKMRAAAAARPRSAVPYELAGDWFFSRQDDSTARFLFERAVKLDSGRPGLYRRLAELELKNGHPELARGFMRKAHELFPTNPKYAVDEDIASVKK